MTNDLLQTGIQQKFGQLAKGHHFVFIVSVQLASVGFAEVYIFVPLLLLIGYPKIKT